MYYLLQSLLLNLLSVIVNSQAIEGLVLIGHTALTQPIFIGVTIETIH